MSIANLSVLVEIGLMQAAIMVLAEQWLKDHGLDMEDLTTFVVLGLALVILLSVFGSMLSQ